MEHGHEALPVPHAGSLLQATDALIFANAALISEIADTSDQTIGPDDPVVPKAEPEDPAVGTSYARLNTPCQPPHRRIGSEFLRAATLEAELLNIDPLVRAKIAMLEKVGDQYIESKAPRIAALEKVHLQLRGEIPQIHEQLRQQIVAQMDASSTAGQTKEVVATEDPYEEHPAEQATAAEQADLPTEAYLVSYGAGLEDALVGVLANLHAEIHRLKDSRDESKADQIAALEQIDAKLLAKVSQLHAQIGPQVSEEVENLAESGHLSQVVTHQDEDGGPAEQTIEIKQEIKQERTPSPETEPDVPSAGDMTTLDRFFVSQPSPPVNSPPSSSPDYGPTSPHEDDFSPAPPELLAELDQEIARLYPQATKGEDPDLPADVPSPQKSVGWVNAFPRKRTVVPERPTTVHQAFMLEQAKPPSTSRLATASSTSSARPSSTSAGCHAPLSTPATDQVPKKVTVRSERWRILAAVQAASLAEDDPPAYRSELFLAAPVARDQRYHGRIKSYNPRQGCGFIESSESFAQYRRDVFLHRNEIGDLTVGTPVSFAIQLGRRQRHPQARDVTARPRPSQQAQSSHGDDPVPKRDRTHSPRR